jgi:hypothetical protein
MNYTYEPPSVEQHCLSVWGDNLPAIAVKDDEGDWHLKREVTAWLYEHDDLVNSVMVGSEDFSVCYTFRFKTKEAAMLFKLTFGGSR